jgi:hypothetical protein
MDKFYNFMSDGGVVIAVAAIVAIYKYKMARLNK